MLDRLLGRREEDGHPAVSFHPSGAHSASAVIPFALHCHHLGSCNRRLKGKEMGTPFLVAPDDGGALDDGGGRIPPPSASRIPPLDGRRSASHDGLAMSPIQVPGYGGGGDPGRHYTVPDSSALDRSAASAASAGSAANQSSVREEILEYEKLELLRRLRAAEHQLANGGGGGGADSSFGLSYSSSSPVKEAGAGVLVKSATSVVQVRVEARMVCAAVRPKPFRSQLADAIRVMQSAVEDVAEMHSFTQELLGKLEAAEAERDAAQLDNAELQARLAGKSAELSTLRQELDSLRRISKCTPPPRPPPTAATAAAGTVCRCALTATLTATAFRRGQNESFED